MATNIQSNSQTELKSYLEERLRAQFPSASSQDIVSAVEVAMGRRGYVLQGDQQGQQSQQSQQSQQGQQGQQRNNLSQDNAQRDNVRRENGQGQQNNNQQSSAIASVREAAISAAQAISEPTIKLAAVASAWVSYAATSAAHEQNQQRSSRN